MAHSATAAAGRLQDTVAALTAACPERVLSLGADATHRDDVERIVLSTVDALAASTFL